MYNIKSMLTSTVYFKKNLFSSEAGRPHLCLIHYPKCEDMHAVTSEEPLSPLGLCSFRFLCQRHLQTLPVCSGAVLQGLGHLGCLILPR